MRVLALLAAVAASGSGCLSAKAHFAAGPTATSDGRVGYQVLLGAGIGPSTSDASALRSVSSATINSRGGIGLAQAVETGAIGKRWAWNAGLRFEPVASQTGRAHWVYGALLKPLDFSKRWPSRGKSSFSLGARRAISVGLDVALGYQYEGETAAIISVMPTAEFALVLSD